MKSLFLVPSLSLIYDVFCAYFDGSGEFSEPYVESVTSQFPVRLYASFQDNLTNEARCE